MKSSQKRIFSLVVMIVALIGIGISIAMDLEFNNNLEKIPREHLEEGGNIN